MIQVIVTKIRVALTALVAGIVGILSSWLITKAGSFHAGVFAVLITPLTGLYYLAIGWLEKKFPKLLWLFGALPQPPKP